MSLDGLRAWIGLVEQRLAKRTRVFLVLVAIAVGGAGAALYLAIDAQDSAVSESDLQSVRDELAEGGAPSGESVTGLEAQIEVLRAEIAELEGNSGAGTSASGSGSTTPGADRLDGGTGTAGSSGGAGSGGASGAATVPKTQAQLESLVEDAEKDSDEHK